MAGVFGFSDQDLLNLVYQQHQLMQLLGAKAPGYSYIDPNWTNPQDLQQPTPPLPERNPTRQWWENEAKRMMQDPLFLDSLYLEGQNRLGHTPPMYPEGEYQTGGKKRRDLKAT